MPELLNDNDIGDIFRWKEIMDKSRELLRNYEKYILIIETMLNKDGLTMDWFIFFLVALALIFDFINGFHDSANSVATIVSTRILSPKFAVLWAAFFNFIAFLFFGLHVAGTIGKGIVDVSVIDKQVIFGTLMGAIIWDIITWWLGLPSSSSHALIGGLIGSAMAKAGTGSLVWAGIQKTLIFIIIAPVSGFILGMVLAWIVFRLLYKANPFKVDKVFRIGQLVSAAMYSLGHGGNDAQKTMGIIASLLFSAGYLGPEFHIPLWIVLVMSCSNSTWHHVWRLEDCKNHGTEALQTEAC